jgi:hypothetical protein
MLHKTNKQNATNSKRSYFKILLSVTKCLLNISIYLQSVFAADAHLAEGQVLREKPIVNKGKSLKFREGTQMKLV